VLRCSFCGRRAVYHQRTSGVLMCDRCLIRSVERRFQQTISRYKLIAPNDRVALAVSGGKDSTALLYLMAERCQRYDCELITITIDEGIRGYRDLCISLVKKNAKALGLEHVVVSFERAFGSGLDRIAALLKDRGIEQGICTYCGVLRRSLLNQVARELGADKIATAHNLDDEVQAIMLNYIRADLSRLHRLGPIYRKREGFVPRIKPLREIPEKEIALYTLLRGFEVNFSSCPHIGGMRVKIRNFINELEAEHPTTKYMILRMFDRLRPHLSDALKEFNMRRCQICGEPTPSDVCRVCELLEQVGLERREKTLISEKQKELWRRARPGG